MNGSCALTTFDNPFDPFERFSDWFLFDVGKGYNTCSYLARIAKTSEQFSDEENSSACFLKRHQKSEGSDRNAKISSLWNYPLLGSCELRAYRSNYGVSGWDGVSLGACFDIPFFSESGELDAAQTHQPALHPELP